ncbi:MAG: hypothetical protein U0T82_07795 [Bacteroidales bacterium]
MSTNEIKQHLFEGIENINDGEFLKAIKELIDHKYSPSKTPKLTRARLKRIYEADKQISRGEFLTDAQVNKLIDRWLEE